MRIVHCIPDMRSGGAQRQLIYLVAEQVSRGWETHVAVLHDGPLLSQLHATGARIHRLHASSNHDPRLLWQLVRLVRTVRPQVVQTWLNQMDVLGGAAACMMGIPWVLSERNSALVYPPTIKNRLRSRLANYAQAVVANSVGGKAYWQEQLPTSPARFAVIRNALAWDEISAAEPLSEVDAELSSGQHMLLYAGRLAPQKNLEHLIPAIAKAASRVSLKAYFCGDGTHEEWTRNLLRQHGAQEHVVLKGYRADVWRWMKRADAVISVSRCEGHPNSVLEAAACGRPLILSGIPAHREVLDEQAAWFVDPSSPDEIAEGMIRALVSPAESGRKAQRAQAAVAGLTPAKMAEQYEQVYRSLTRSATQAA